MHTEQHSNLIEAVFAIIDSRIQFVEYEQQNVVNQHAQHQLNEQLEQLIKKIEQFSRTLKLLLILRTNLKKDNANTILDLLTNGKFLSYSVEHLTEVLEHNSYLKTA